MTRPTDTGNTTKSAILHKMLLARGGASLDRLCAATGWQPQSVRGALSRLRKAGYAIERQAPTKGHAEARYRLTGGPDGAR